jgi:hypothetical protein
VKKPAKRTVTAWVFAASLDESEEQTRVRISRDGNFIRTARAEMRRDNFRVGPLVRIEVPLPSRGTR